jgi:Flp pilus assembly protein TadG
VTEPQIKARSRRRERGQSLVEFALILPILMGLLLLTIDVGRLFYAYVGVENASREGAAYAITSAPAAGNLNGVSPNITTKAQQEGATTYTVTSACTPSPCVANGTVKVSVSTTFNFLFPILLSNMQLGGASTGVIQGVIQ